MERSIIVADLNQFILMERLLNGKEFQRVMIGIPTYLRPVSLSSPTEKLRYKIQAISAHHLQNLLRKKIKTIKNFGRDCSFIGKGNRTVFFYVDLFASYVFRYFFAC